MASEREQVRDLLDRALNDPRPDAPTLEEAARASLRLVSRRPVPDPEPTDALVERLELMVAAMEADGEPTWAKHIRRAIARLRSMGPSGAYEHPEHGLTCHVGGCSLEIVSSDEGTNYYRPVRSMGEPDGWEVECDTDWGPGWHYGGDTREEAHEQGRQMIAYTRRVRPYWTARYGGPVTVATPTDEPEEGEDG